jgi:hypothetical protein
MSMLGRLAAGVGGADPFHHLPSPGEIPMTLCRTSLALCVLAGSALAQNFTYSPASAGTTEQNANNTIPFWYGSARYQQVHGSLRGAPRLLQAISIRRDGMLGTFGSAVARTIDAEMVMAHTNFATVSGTFASNYAGTPVTTVNRRMINLPDWTANLGSPAPWLAIPHDNPFAYTGNLDLLWELRIHSNTNTGSYPADAFSGFNFDIGSATNVSFGTGCTATGRTSPMTISANVQSVNPTNSLRVQWSVFNGPAGAPCAVLVGLSGIDQAVSGLCSNLYVGNILLVINGTKSGTGSFTTPAIEATPFDPAWVGGKLYAQGAAIDNGRTDPIPVSVSNRVESTIVAVPGGSPDKIRRIWVSDVNATVGSLSENYNYGLAVRFSHP